MSNLPGNPNHQTLSASLSDASELSAGSPATGTGSTRGVVTADEEKQVKNKYSLAFDDKKEFQSMPLRNLKMMVRGVLCLPNERKITLKVWVPTLAGAPCGRDSSKRLPSGRAPSASEITKCRNRNV